MMRLPFRHHIGLLSLAVCLLTLLPLAPLSRAAGLTPNTPPIPTRQRWGPSDPQEVAAHFDPFFAQQLAEFQIPGAVFVLVKDGVVLFSKGYGYADRERQRPVRPDETIFHLMSVSKLFTATAIMQLVEQGKIDLNADVNRYLKGFQVEAAPGQPVTVAHLLTHTGGLDFDLDNVGVEAQPGTTPQPLGQFLAAHPPLLMQQPGVRFGYSNAAFDTLGAIVESVSGRPFEQYIDEQIMQPLGMGRSSMRQPPPLTADLVTTYDRGQPAPFPTFHNAPSRALTGTASDMARFMIAHLEGGRYGDGHILQQATVQEMQRQHFTHHPRMAGIAYGFFETGAESRPRSLWHEGQYGGLARSLMVLIPEQRVGFLVAYNSDAEPLVGQIYGHFYPHYYPQDEQPVAPQPLATGSSPAERFVGVYRSAGYGHRTIVKSGMILNDDYPEVLYSDDGALALRFNPNNPPIRLIETASLFFQSEDASLRVAFQTDGAGHISHMLLDTQVFERLDWYETSRFNQALLYTFVALFLLTIIGLLAWTTLRRRSNAPSLARSDRLALLLLVAVAALNSVFVIALAVLLPQASSLGINYGMPLSLVALLCLPPLATLLTILLVVAAALLWLRRRWPPLWRIAYTLAALAALAFIPFLISWNLLGFQW